MWESPDARERDYPKTPTRQEVPKHLELAEKMASEICAQPDVEIYEMVSLIRDKARAELQNREINMGELIERSKSEQEKLKKLAASI